MQGDHLKMTASAPGTSKQEPTDKMDDACPRCQYSLRGLRSTRCPECGHEICWDEIRSLDEARVSGFYEYCSHKNALKCFIFTWWRAVWPVPFWQWATPFWPVRRRRVMLFAALMLLLTVPMLAVLMTVIHFGFLHWLHGGSHSLLLYIRAGLPLYVVTAIENVLPCIVGGLIVWGVGALIAPSHARGNCARLFAYPLAFVPLLIVAVPARLISALFVYASRPNADWAMLFWWLQPGAQWSNRVYIHMIDTGWFRGGLEWSNPLRVVTLGALLAVCAPLIFVNSSLIRKIRYVGIVFLALLWPVSIVYASWVISITVGSRRYLTGKRGELVGVATGISCLGLLLLLNGFLGGTALLEVLGAWPL